MMAEPLTREEAQAVIEAQIEACRLMREILALALQFHERDTKAGAA